MAAVSFYSQQALRLSCLSNFPQWQAGVDELARAVEESSGQNARFAKELVDAFVDDGGKCPDPRDIRQRAWHMVHPEQESSIGKSNCPRCQGRGFVSFQKARRWNGDLVRYDYAAACRCRGVVKPPVEEEPQKKRQARMAKASEVRLPYGDA